MFYLKIVHFYGSAGDGLDDAFSNSNRENFCYFHRENNKVVCNPGLENKSLLTAFPIIVSKKGDNQKFVLVEKLTYKYLTTVDNSRDSSFFTITLTDSLKYATVFSSQNIHIQNIQDFNVLDRNPKSSNRKSRSKMIRVLGIFNDLKKKFMFFFDRGFDERGFSKKIDSGRVIKPSLLKRLKIKFSNYKKNLCLQKPDKKFGILKRFKYFFFCRKKKDSEEVDPKNVGTTSLSNDSPSNLDLGKKDILYDNVDRITVETSLVDHTPKDKVKNEKKGCFKKFKNFFKTQSEEVINDYPEEVVKNNGVDYLRDGSTIYVYDCKDNTIRVKEKGKTIKTIDNVSPKKKKSFFKKIFGHRDSANTKPEIDKNESDNEFFRKGSKAEKKALSKNPFSLFRNLHNHLMVILKFRSRYKQDANPAIVIVMTSI